MTLSLTSQAYTPVLALDIIGYIQSFRARWRDGLVGELGGSVAQRLLSKLGLWLEASPLKLSGGALWFLHLVLYLKNA